DTCMRDGYCDGKRACRLYRAGTTCKAGGCAGSTRTLASACDGTGLCEPGQEQSCAPYNCGANGKCLTTCTPGGSGECMSGSCSATGSCGKKPSGQSCTAPADCASGFCEQGICCGSACSS